MREKIPLPEVCFGQTCFYYLIQRALFKISSLTLLDASPDYEDSFVDPVGSSRMLWIKGKLHQSGCWLADASFIQTPNLGIKMELPPPASMQIAVIGGYLKYSRYGRFIIKYDGQEATIKVALGKTRSKDTSSIDEIGLERKIRQLEKQNDLYFDLIQLQSPDRIERHKTDNSRIVIESFDIAKSLELSRI